MSTNRSNIYKNYNPDILETIANLSNDEVFTPPKLANQILDLLPKEVYRIMSIPSMSEGDVNIVERMKLTMNAGLTWKTMPIHLYTII